LATYGDRGVGVWLGQGDGSFSLVDGAPILVGANNYPDLSNPGTLVDVNGDGNLDLLLVVSFFQVNFVRPGGFVVCFGDGTGKLTYNQNTYFAFPTGYTVYGLILPVPPVVSDFNGDGKVDLLLSTRDHSNPNAVADFILSHGNGNGTSTPTVTTPIPAYPQQTVIAYAAGDFNYDGHV